MIVLEDLAGALDEARERTLAILAPLTDADVESVHTPMMSPLAWDLAHIAAYEDLWIGHRLGGRDLLRPGLAEMYDAFETPRAARGSLPLLDRAGALEYLGQVRECSREVLAERGDENPGLVELVLRHEQQHDETMLQAIGLARLARSPGMPRFERPGAAGPVSGLERVEIPAGPCTIGAGPDGFAYDNERPRTALTFPAFAIGRQPLTNGDVIEFIEAGGYHRREWWSADGWTWRTEESVGAPMGWSPAEDASWRTWRVDGEAPVALGEPVIHVSYYEAEAYARSHGARLPTEFEWEKAASWAPESGEARAFPWGDDAPEPGDGRANLDHGAFGPVPAGSLEGASAYGVEGMLGDTWEWTCSDFAGYPGFAAHPYPEYSEVFFGSRYKVLRGGSWATRARVPSPSFRNWDLPQRRQIFSGVRLVWDAGA